MHDNETRTTQLGGQDFGDRGNLLLSALAEPQRSALLPLMNVMAFRKGDVLQVQGEPVRALAFVDQGTIALVLKMGAGPKTRGAGVVGSEGLVGVSALLDDCPVALHSAVALESGVARVIKVQAVQPFIAERDEFRRRCLSYAHAKMHQSLSLSACNHEFPLRFASWLLVLHRRFGCDRLRFSQREFAELLLGVRRATVTNAVKELEQLGAIAKHRNALIIKDQARIRSVACGCGDGLVPCAR